MAVASAPLLPNSDAIRNVGQVLPWLAGTPDRARFSPGNLVRTTVRETRDAVADLKGSLRERHDSVGSAVSAMTDKLRTEVEAAPAGTTMDPDGSGVLALEEAEKHFRAECNDLREIRDALERSGGQPAHGEGIFRELDRLDGLFSGIVQWCQEIRWLLMINDGAMAPTTGKTFKSGAELVSSLMTE